MPQYQVLRMETIGTPPILGGDGPLKFDNPQDASQFAKVHSRAIGEKLCVKAIVDEKWRIREEARFNNGTYRILPWADEGHRWWTSDAAYSVWKDHYPHASLEKPGFISYTKSPADGAADKQTLLRPGAYLNRYFSKILQVYGYSEQGLVDQFNTMYGPTDVKFAATEKEILEVYKRGPKTCLYEGRDYPKGIHPASIYAAGDLQIAYLGDIKGNVSARVVVWPEKKLYSRVYGDIARLTTGLMRLGYKWGAPVGAKLKRIKLRDVDLTRGRIPTGCFLVPYLDKKNQQGGGHLAVKDMGDHLIICMDNEPGTHHAGLPDGMTGQYVPRPDEFPTYRCDRCEEQHRHLWQVYFGVDGRRHESWCEECRDNGANPCHYSGNYYHEDVPMVEVDGNTWLANNAKMYAVRCEGSGYYTSKNNSRVVYLPDGKSKRFSIGYIEDRGGIFTSGLTGRAHFKEEKAIYYSGIHGRNYCSNHELRNFTFQCDGCDQNWTIGERNQKLKDDRLFCPFCCEKIADGTTPVSKSRKIFEEERKQGAFRLEAAE